MLVSLFERLRRRPGACAAVFFACLFLAGLLAFRAYGVPWDEPNMYRAGEAAYSYVFEGKPWPEEHALRYYGMVFELPAVILTHLAGFTQLRPAIFLRHFLVFCTFFAGTWFFYLLAKKLLKNSWLALLGAVFLVLSPRIFADAFYNSKDLPNLALFTAAAYTLVRFLEEKNAKRALLHGLATALAIGLRLTSLLLPALTVLFVVLHALRDARSERGTVRRSVMLLALYLCAAALCTYAVWPFLWSHPVSHLLEAYRFMSGQPIDTYYMGERITRLPWHYVFVWIGITTPLLYTFFFLIGLAAIAATALHRPTRWLLESDEQLLPLLWFFLPILSVYATGAGIFDGWRHLYFLYPAFLLIALYGVRATYDFWERVLAQPRRLAVWFVGVLAVHSLWMAAWLVRNHPVQNAYFSIPARYVQHNFELDYWGLSFRPALERLLRMDSSPSIAVWMTSSPGASALSVLLPEEQARIQYVKEEQATYVLNNYRGFDYAQTYPHPEVSAIKAGGVKILGIYKIR